MINNKIIKMIKTYNTDKNPRITKLIKDVEQIKEMLKKE
jgi:hypothetical protein